MGKRIYLNDEWVFNEKFSDKFLGGLEDFSDVSNIRIPHSCKETKYNYFDESEYQMTSGYRKTIFADESMIEKTVLLTFEGVAHDAQVFLNGIKIATHHCGYTAFTVDISDFLLYDEENILVVRVDSRENLNIPPFGFVIDYMTYGGIYRDVYLDIKEKIYCDDIFIHSKLNFKKNQALMTSDISIKGLGANDEITIKQYIRKKGKGIFHLLVNKSINGNVAAISCLINNPKLWNVDSPNLYEIKTELVKDSKVVDERIDVTGFRKAVFRKDGFYLNGKKFKIRGLNRHQSYPYVGYAMPDSMQRLDARILKEELSLNAVRTSHYPQSQSFINACDEIGLLVFTEMPGWQHIGDEKWKRQAEINVKEMILQYRNHPSIILWGVRINESVDDDEFYTRTNNIAKELDPYRQTGGVRAYARSNLLEDVYTYNDFLHDGKTKGCENKSKITSDMSKPYLITEYGGHMFPTKAFDSEEHILSHALRHANVLDEVNKQKDISGSFGWCMCDYNTHKDFGSGDRICYHGVMDMFRNPKLAASIYSMQGDKNVVLNISSSMDIGEHPACIRGDTYIFTNADSVKMYKNDRFIKEYNNSHSRYKNLKHGPIIIDDYIGDAVSKGEKFTSEQAESVKELMNLAARYGMADLPRKAYLIAAKLVIKYHMKPESAVTYFQKYVGDWGGEATNYRFEAVKNGEIVKKLNIEAVNDIYLNVNADHTNLKEDKSYDVALVRINVTDKFGNILRFYNDVVKLKVEGDIEIIGPDAIALNGGMGGTFVKTNKKIGSGKLFIETRNKCKEIEFRIN